MTRILLEVCVDDHAGLAAAVEGGADRVELCSALALGGLTPSAGFMSAAASAPIPIYAMIRPRDGDFVYSDAELDIMAGDIAAARNAGLAGVVFGVTKADGRLDEQALRNLADASGGLGLTLHRAFDLTPDREEAIEIAIDIGFERILTSGGAPTAAEGAEVLESLIAAAAGRISVMPGAGVTLEAIDLLLPRLEVTEIHSSCATPRPISDRKVVSLGFSPPEPRRTDAALVRNMQQRIARQKI